MVSNIFYFHPENWGRFPFWLLFFKGVETTNQWIKTRFLCLHFGGRFARRCRCSNCDGCATWFALYEKPIGIGRALYSVPLSEVGWLMKIPGWLSAFVCRFMKIERKPCLSLDFFRCNIVPNQNPSTRSAICICVAKTQESFLAKITHWSVSQRAVIKIKQDSTFDLVNWVCISHGTKIIFQSSTDWFSENNYAWSSRSAKKLCLQKKRIFSTMTGFSQLVT